MIFYQTKYQGHCLEQMLFISIAESKRPQLSEGEKVMVWGYRGNTNKWTDAKITQKTGPLSNKITTGEKGDWLRHDDKMRSTSCKRPWHVESTLDVSTKNRIGID